MFFLNLVRICWWLLRSIKESQIYVNQLEMNTESLSCPLSIVGSLSQFQSQGVFQDDVPFSPQETICFGRRVSTSIPVTWPKNWRSRNKSGSRNSSWNDPAVDIEDELPTWESHIDMFFEIWEPTKKSQHGFSVQTFKKNRVLFVVCLTEQWKKPFVV